MRHHGNAYHYPPHAYHQQPHAIPGMTIGGGGNRNARNVPMGPDGRDWSNGLCDCCNSPGTCLLSCCCPCIVYAKNKQRCEHLNVRGFPDPKHGGSCCSGDCWLHGLLTAFCCGWILQCSQRDDVRQRYNIEGGACSDCCTAAWCTPCELTQEYQELRLEEKSFGRHF